MLTEGQLRSIMPNADTATWLGPLTAAMAARDISTPLRVATFLAHVAVESGEMRRLVENMHYSAARMMAVWPNRFPTEASALPFAGDPEKLGNFVYADRMGNGSPESGDGFRYRGRGLLQATGREHYGLGAAELRLDLLARPELLEETEHATAEAAWWWQRQGCNAIADTGDLKASTRRINGGLTGFPDRLAFWRRATAVLGADAALTEAEKERERVRRVQAGLNAAGAVPQLDTDGQWGRKSEDAADAFRAARGLPAANGWRDLAAFFGDASPLAA